MTDDNSLRSALEKALGEIVERVNQPYDGVLGALPDWVPENFCAEFESTRNKLLRDGYSAAALLTFIDEIIQMEEIALADPDNHPVFRPSTPFQIFPEVSLLARFKVAISLGEERGLALLLGNSHANQIAKAKKYSKHQSGNAKKPRNRVKVGGEGLSITTVVRQLSNMRDEIGDLLPAKDLWNDLLSELDKLELNPEEKTKNKKPLLVTYDISDDGKRTDLKYSSFQAMLSRERKKTLT